MSKAVAEVYGVKLSGTLAWLLWRGFYLQFFPGFAGKLRVLVNWLLNVVTPPNIVQVLSTSPATRYIHYRKGDKVLEPGMVIDGFYTVIKGSLRLTIDNPATGEHFEKLFGPGGHFGERVLLKSALRTGLVVALEDTTVLWISQKDFIRFVRAFLPRRIISGVYRRDLAARGRSRGQRQPSPGLRLVLLVLRSEARLDAAAFSQVSFRPASIVAGARKHFGMKRITPDVR
jgi:NADH dehydrogenase